MFWVIRLRRMRWAGHVARLAEKKETYELLVIRSEPKRLIEKLISVRIILKRIFRDWMGEIELD
jgi:hypothetical protein